MYYKQVNAGVDPMEVTIVTAKPPTAMQPLQGSQGLNPADAAYPLRVGEA